MLLACSERSELGDPCRLADLQRNSKAPRTDKPHDDSMSVGSLGDIWRHARRV